MDEVNQAFKRTERRDGNSICKCTWHGNERRFDTLIKHQLNSAVMLRFAQKLRDPLYRNSFFIMLSSVTNASFGFFFWMIAARLYSAEDVGIATALLSSLGLIILLSRLGFDFSIIRFFSKRRQKRIFGTSVVVSTVAALLLGIVSVAGMDIFSPKLRLMMYESYSETDFADAGLHIVENAFAVLRSLGVAKSATVEGRGDRTKVYVDGVRTNTAPKPVSR